MAQRIAEEDLYAIETVVAAHPNGIGVRDIMLELKGEVARRTLQYHLKHLVDQDRLVKEGQRRGTRYRMPEPVKRDSATAEVPKNDVEGVISRSQSATAIRDYVCKPVEERTPVGYDRRILDGYRPNDSAYLSEVERAHLQTVGSASSGEQPAGTYAKQILNRLLIDLSWNSSRLEGNTYSLLDTKRLIDFGAEAEGKGRLEAQMILNHKDAIEFLVASAAETGINRYTLLNLHALLANNLLADPEATGRLRRIAVGIEKSVFHPLEVPQLIEECFDQLLATAAAIRDPFEQSFFLMVHLPYLQPFDDVNKRVSRLAASIPFIKANLTPLSFTGVPTKTYTEAVLGVYELNKIDLLKEVYIWAYERSAARYVAVRQSLGEPDPFRLQHRNALREIVRVLVIEKLHKKMAFEHIAAWAKEHIEADEVEQFREVAENEVLGLHEGNYARFQIKPSQFEAWQGIWQGAD